MNKKKKIKWVLTSSSLRAEFDGARLSPVAIGRLLRRRGLLLAMTIVIVFLFFAPGLTVLAQAPPLTKPALGVDIPGLDFGKNFADVAQKTEDGVLIPFLAQYISAAYRYLIGVSVIVAIIVVMYGGFLYMVGSAVSDVKRGKKYIFDAILGLVIILSAYLIL
ncbi:MAG: hypothetical protein Q7N87_01770, partial [Candidatus Uhrbacteria bacterium]|nr:hypothetical protein [Candidatus Uhrbacteria bacterium]